MQTYKALIYLCFGFVVLLLPSCDSKARYDKLISNNTPYTITILGGNIDDLFDIYFEDSISVPPSTKLHFLGNSFLGGAVSGFTDCPFYPESGDTLFVQALGPDDTIHEFFITENDDWEHFIISQDKKGINGSCECILNIDEEDLPF
ncbi:MAG: hypothetical protein R8G66_22190 [Cytophagales bacterium]|nr:hypothetical protein [Cytophagales bacterium]